MLKLPINKLLKLIIVLVLALSGSISALELNFNSPEVLAHLTQFKLINEQIKGFHHYQPASFTTNDGITISKINSTLWIVTAGDHNDFHEGYIVYNGKLCGNKSFFPCKWNKDQLKAVLSTIQIDQKIENSSKNEYKINYNLDGKQPLVVITTYYPNSKKSFIKTIYPVINKSKEVNQLDLDKIVNLQANELMGKPQQISNVKDIILSEIEKNITKENVDLDYFYYKILSSDNEQINKIAQEILILAIGHYKSEIFDIALPYCQINEEVLNRLMSKPRDDKLAQERAKMIKFTLLQNPNLQINEDILIKALKTQSKEILDSLIFNFAYLNKLDSISEQVKNNKMAKEIIQSYKDKINKLIAKGLNAPIFQAIFFGNIIKAIELIESTKLDDLKKVLQSKEVKDNPELFQKIKEKINKIKEEEQLKIEAIKQKEEQVKKENLKQFFVILAHARENDFATSEEIEILRANKNYILFSNKPLLEVCINNMEIGKIRFIKQLIEDVKCDITEQVFLAAFNKEIIHLLLPHIKVGHFLLDWIKTDEGFNRFVEFIKKHPEYLEEVIKSKDFTLSNFISLITKLDSDLNTLLITATQVDRADLVDHLIKKGTCHKQALKVAKKGTKSFELLNDFEQEKQAEAQKIKAIEDLQIVAKQKKEADEHAQNMGWTHLIRAIHEDLNYTDLIDLITDQNTDLESKDVSGKTAYDYAIAKNHKNIATHISYKIKLNKGNLTEYEKLAYRNDKTQFKKLITKGELIDIFDIKITPDLENINLYMHLCNPKTSEKEKIDALLEISEIKRSKIDALMKISSIEDSNKIIKEIDEVYSNLFKRTLTEEQLILISFNIVQKNLIIYKFKPANDCTELINQTIKFLKNIIKSDNLYTDQFKNKCKLDLTDLYHDNPNLIDGNNDKNAEITKLILEVLNDKNVTMSQKTLGYYLLAKIMFDLEYLDTSLMYFEKALKNKKNLLSEQIAITNYRLACIYHEKNINMEIAISTFELLMNDDTLTTDLLSDIINRLNRIYVKQNNNIKLIELYNKVLKKNISDQLNNTSLLILGKLLYYQDNFKDALKFYKKYISHQLTEEVDKINAYYYLANSYFMNKKMTEAILYMQNYLKENIEDNVENIINKIDLQIKLASIYSNVDSNINQANLIDLNKVFDLCIQSLTNEIKLSTIKHEKNMNALYATKLRDKILIKLLNNFKSEDLIDYLEKLLKPEYVNILSNEIRELAKEKLILLSTNSSSSASSVQQLETYQNGLASKEIQVQK